jgi:hypothetical protein
LQPILPHQTISDKIKDILYAKASEKIELIRPVIANQSLVRHKLKRTKNNDDYKNYSDTEVNFSTEVTATGAATSISAATCVRLYNNTAGTTAHCWGLQ